MELPPEIVECIFYQLAPIGTQPYVGDVDQALRACFAVSKFVRSLAMLRIFHSLNIDSSISPGRLELLLSILEPASPLSWMSVRRFIQCFVFYIYPLERKPTDWALTHPFKADDFVSLFLSLSRGNEHSQMSSVVFTVAPFDFPVFTQTFEDVVLDFMKLPSLRSLEIHGLLLIRDFLPDSHINTLYITRYGLDPDPLSREVNSTNAFGFPLLPLRGDSLPTYPGLRTLKTDLTWPRGIEDKKFDPMFQNITSFIIIISTPPAFKNAEAVIPKMKSLRNLTIMYKFDGYEEELPINWKLNFGGLHALETLKFVWENSISSERQDAIARGSRPLAGLLGLLDTIHSPMLNLTTVHWSFRYARVSLPSDVLGQWMESDNRWDKLDHLLTSDMFPSLQTTEIVFCPISLVSTLDNTEEEEDDRIFTTAVIDMKSVEEVASERREKTFPRLAASLGKNLIVLGKSQMLLTDAGKVVSGISWDEEGAQRESYS